MAAPKRLAGLASIFVAGTAYQASGELEYQPTATKREPLYGLDGSFQGWSETGEAPYIKCKFRDDGTLSVAQIYAMTNVQVVAELANGKTVSGSQMTPMEAIPVRNEDATYEVKWMGPDVTEDVAS